MDAATENSLRTHFDAWAQTHGATRVGSTQFGDRYQDAGGRPVFVVHVVVERDGTTSFMHLGGAAFAPIGAQLLDSNDFRVGCSKRNGNPAEPSVEPPWLPSWASSP